MKKPPVKRRLFLDLETSPNVGLFWRPGYRVNISHDNIIQEKAIICIGYKWENDKKVHCPTWDRDQDDKKLLENFIPIMNQADEIVAHFGDSFDIPWLRSRCIKHGIPMMPSYTTIDTKKEAKNFFFNSYKLDYIADYLGLGKKIKTDYDLWKDVLLKNDRKALKKMTVYCKRDVELLEKVWKKMNPYVVAKSNFACYSHACPECGSENTSVQKRRVTAAGYKKVQFVCKDCNKYHTMAESKFNKRKEI